MLQKFSIGALALEIKRDFYLNKLIARKHNGLIKVITGVRRCGKSYLLFTQFKKHLQAEGVDREHIIEIAFDSFENKKFRDPELLYPYINDIVGRHKIRNKEEFEDLINILSSGIGSLTNPKKLADTFKSRKKQNHQCKYH